MHDRTDVLLGDAPPDARRIFDELRVELCVGQYLDLVGTAGGSRDPAQAARIERYKSGKYTVERPLQLSFEVTPEKTDAALAARAVEKLPEPDRAALRSTLETMAGQTWRARYQFTLDLKKYAASVGLTLAAPVVKAVVGAVGEHDPDAEICKTPKGEVEPDPALRDTERVPLAESIETYVAREVLPHVPDAWVDEAKTKVGYEIPINRHFYVYKPPRPLPEIEADIRELEAEIADLLKGLMA